MTLTESLKTLETMPARVTGWQEQLLGIERDLHTIREELATMRGVVDSSIRKIEQIVHDHPVAVGEDWSRK